VRIGIFSECYHPVLNGVVVSIDTFKSELEKRGHEFFIFTTKCPGYEETSRKVKRFSCMLPFKPSGGKYPISWPRIAWFEARNIKDFNLDIIHSQHLLNLGHLGLKIGEILKIPTVLTYHTLLAEYSHYTPVIGGLTRRYLLYQSRVISNRYDQVVTPSPSMKRVLRDYGVTAPIEAIATGVNLADFQNPFHREVLCAKWRIPENQKILLYVSRIAKEKNLDFLFDAVRLLDRKRSDFHLLMVGGGPELEYYKKMVAFWNLQSRVTFTGMQEKIQANRFFGAADIFVFPSITETQGIVITEAMAAGIPAVAIDKMGPSDIIEDGKDGFLTPLKIVDFTDKIEKLLDDDNLRQQMGKKARESSKKYSVEICADQMEELYEKTIANHHRS